MANFYYATVSPARNARKNTAATATLYFPATQSNKGPAESPAFFVPVRDAIVSAFLTIIRRTIHNWKRDLCAFGQTSAIGNHQCVGADDAHSVGQGVRSIVLGLELLPVLHPPLQD